MGARDGGMIEIKNIKKTFGDKTVIQDVSAVMKPGNAILSLAPAAVAKPF